MISENTLSQTNEEFINSNLNLLSRFRLSVGYVELLENDYDYNFRHPFFNVSFRSSGFDKASSSFGVKFAFDSGINGLIISNETSATDFSLYFVPYAKLGPEMRLYNNIFLSPCAGFLFVFFETAFGVLPFAGINSFYLLPLNDHLNIELEGGFHTSFYPEDLPVLFYITAGISYN